MSTKLVDDLGFLEEVVGSAAVDAVPTDGRLFCVVQACRPVRSLPKVSTALVRPILIENAIGQSA